MTQLRVLGIVSVVASLVLGCGHTGLQTSAGAGPRISVGDSSLRIVTMSDLDEVRDVAVTPEKIYVATDLGVVVYPSRGPITSTTRLTLAQGLPSDDARALAATADGATVFVATPNGVGKISGDTVTALAAPPVGALQDLAVAHDGTLWACGLGGLAKWSADAWLHFGNAAKCTTLEAAADGKVYAGTTSGLLIVDGEVIREHTVTGGIPTGYVRALVPLEDGKLYALLADRSTDTIGYFDGHKWYGYSIDGFTPPVVNLVRRDHDVVLVTPSASFVITPSNVPGAGSVRLVALSMSNEATVRSYRPESTPADQVTLDATAQDENVLRHAAPLAEVPASHPSLDAPDLRARPAGFESPPAVYFATGIGPNLYLADINRGVDTVGATGGLRWLRTNDLVPERNLQIASEAEATWLMSKTNDVCVYRRGRVRRVHVADGIVPQAVASGPLGIYVIAMVTPAPAPTPPSTPPPAPGHRPAASRRAAPAAPPPPPPGTAVRIYKLDGNAFTLVAERRVVTPTPLLTIPFAGVAPDGKVWISLRLQRPGANDGMMRGIAILDPGQGADVVSFLHARATTETDGPLAKQIPDDVSCVEFTTTGDVWLASLTGAVRVGGSQAVTFGEARGVRGEIVNDLAIGPHGEIWLATVEGVGVYQESRFDFNSLPRVVHEARPLALAVDPHGNLWGAGAHGIVYYDGHTWQQLDEAHGFPTNHLLDVEVDAQSHVWLLAHDSLMLFLR